MFFTQRPIKRMKTCKTTITKEELNEFPHEFYPGSIVVVDTVPLLQKAMSFLNQQKIVGIDTETKPVFTKGKKNKVALLQISNENICFLLRLNHIGFNEEIGRFFSNPDIKKIGLSLKDDFLMLRARFSTLEPKGFIDLQDYVKVFGIEDSSLQKIYALLFEKKISKSQRLSNWEAEQLTTAQQNYAALDAYACLKIYFELNSGNLCFLPKTEEEFDE
jgi:ribonuclease D